MSDLSLWKNLLRENREGKPPIPQYQDHFIPYSALPGHIQLLFDTLEDVLDHLTEK